MDFDTLNNFVTLAKHLNYNKAAADLHITQPTLSKCISRLEGELGKQLFFRNNRGVFLTPDGEIALRHAKSMLNQSNLLLNELQTSDTKQHHHLRLGVLSHSIHLYLPGFMREYKESHPNVSIHLVDGDQSTLIDEYLSGNIDMFIGTQGACEPLAHCKKTLLNEEKICILVPTHSEYAKLDVIDLEDVKDETFVLLGNTVSHLTPQYNRNNITMKLCALHKFVPKTIPCRLFPNIPLMVACGMGLAILSEAGKFYGKSCVTYLPIKGHENDTMKIYSFYDELNESIAVDFSESLYLYIKRRKAEKQIYDCCE